MEVARCCSSGSAAPLRSCSPAVGLLVARVEPRNAIGWIFLVLGRAARGRRRGLRVRRPRDLRRRVVAGRSLGGVVRGLGLHPGRLRRSGARRAALPERPAAAGAWRSVLWISVAVAVASTLAAMLDPGADRRRIPSRDEPARRAGCGRRRDPLFDDGSGVLLAPPVLLASAAALVVRFRRSRGIERQQMKWLAFAGAVPVTRVRALVRLGLGRRRRARAVGDLRRPASPR